MEYLPLIGTVTIIQILAVMSPGPDFIMTVRNSLTYSRRTGIWTAVGFGCGIFVHVCYSLAGLALIISQSILLFSVIKYAGAAYLIYIGIKSALARGATIEIADQQQKQDISRFTAVRMGFLTNILNPKATLFILSLFTLVISPDTPPLILAILALIIVSTTIAWFTLVSIFMTQRHIRGVFERFQNLFNKTFGGLLILLGIKVALTEK
jgi:RhtB (resistance to homoserine/threonine) family protein